MKKVISLLKRIKPIYYIVFMPLLIFGTYTFAKFVTEEFHSYFTNSKNFYFTSNILTEDNNLYQINNWIGIGQFNISYELYSKENNYVFTEYDVTYVTSVSCSDDVLCEVDKPSGTIYSSSHEEEIHINIVPQRLFNEGEKIVIQINAESSSPYVKKLSAKFEYIVGKHGVTYEIEDEPNRAYLLLKITNALNYCTVQTAFDTYSVGDAIEYDKYRLLSDDNKAKCVSQHAKLDFNPNEVIIDNTGDILKKSTFTTTPISGIDFINRLEFNIGPLTTASVKFYKNNPANNYTFPIVNNSSIIDVEITDP